MRRVLNGTRLVRRASAQDRILGMIGVACVCSSLAGTVQAQTAEGATPPVSNVAPAANPLPASRAEENAPQHESLPIDIHAFVSQGFLISTHNNYLARSKDGSFEYTEVAANLGMSITERLRVGMQLFVGKLGPTGNFIPVLDWASADYRFADWLGLRVGRTKIPFGLYNESRDIDAARVPALLPYSIYPDHHRGILFALTGGELYGNIALGNAGQLEYRAYGGTFSFEGGGPNKPGVDHLDITPRYLVGGRLMWLTPLEGLQLGASFQALRYDTVSTFNPAITQVLVAAKLAPADFTGVINLDFPIQLWVASAEYAAGDLLLSAEYGRWWADLRSSQPTIIPSSGPTNERFYVMASYRVSSWFVPGAYYSGYYVDVDKRGGRQNHQHDVSATLRFDLTPNWLLKLEAHWMLGTAALESYRNLNDDKELQDLTRRWCMFLAKTTAYF
jgi:hypothetical protein